MGNETDIGLWSKPTGGIELVLEAWSEGLVLGALLIMSAITVANMRKGVLLHKIIFIELFIAIPDCFAIYQSFSMFGWYLSSTSTLIICSWTIHNVVAWMKIKPFLGRTWSFTYIATVISVQPYWVLEIYANFAYFNRINEKLFPKTRPFEPLFRDPWWIFTTATLFWNVKYRYEFGLIELIKVSPRFGIMLLSMILSIAFIILDVLAVTPVLHIGGLNPFWKISVIFKCLTDTIILDDFQTALNKISQHRQIKLRLEQLQGSAKTRSRQIDGGAQTVEMWRSKDIVIETDIRVEHAEAVGERQSHDSSTNSIYQRGRNPWDSSPV